jgi:phosphoserine phosphatase
MGDIAILDMDGTLLCKRSIDVLCEHLGFKERLAEFDRISSALPAYRVGEEIAQFFRDQPRQKLERIFDTIPLSDGASQFVGFLKRSKFLVAIATDSYEFLAQRLAQRIGADVVYGHIVEIKDGILTGRLLTAHRCLKIKGCREYSVCKLSFMRDLRRAEKGLVIAVGDSDSDYCVMTEADISIAYRPRSKLLMQVARIHASSFADVERILRLEIETRRNQSQ